ncbi:hypothetical protein M758_UG163100 [Ceratodon purpureus]|nr:hypothetical protein M758_UG163100 [Ceratodon purpureus]
MPSPVIQQLAMWLPVLMTCFTDSTYSNRAWRTSRLYILQESLANFKEVDSSLRDGTELNCLRGGTELNCFRNKCRSQVIYPTKAGTGEAYGPDRV